MTSEQIKHALERVDAEIKKRIARGDSATTWALYQVAKQRNQMENNIQEMAEILDLDDIFTC